MCQLANSEEKEHIHANSLTGKKAQLNMNAEV